RGREVEAAAGDAHARRDVEVGRPARAALRRRFLDGDRRFLRRRRRRRRILRRRRERRRLVFALGDARAFLGLAFRLGRRRRRVFLDGRRRRRRIFFRDRRRLAVVVAAADQRRAERVLERETHLVGEQ